MNMIYRDKKWQAIETRDHHYDGVFYYGVLTTGIYCKPSCPSRQPKPENIRYFQTVLEAEAAGFRACKRCTPHLDGEAASTPPHLQRIKEHIERHFQDTLPLDQLASLVNLSPAHLQKSFKIHFGLSPKEYQNSLRIEALKRALKDGDPITGAIYDVGFGSNSRIYEQVNTRIGMTLSAYQSGGIHQEITYCFVTCHFAKMLIATTERGICFLHFGDREDDLFDALLSEFPNASLTSADVSTKGQLGQWAEALNLHFSEGRDVLNLPLDVNGTAFQMRVWKFLTTIPEGETRSYSEIAKAMGHPKATRAVASAIAKNTIGYLIPCHRVIRGDGSLGGYRWGLDTKKALLANEATSGSASV